ncbi:hypothetical protein EDB83DRAFT_270983 [Lactarius deliciosus]|nr:hypothetical protein EDB83DRAFT_270983 [Lactarius deliciosus]
MRFPPRTRLRVRSRHPLHLDQMPPRRAPSCLVSSLFGSAPRANLLRGRCESLHSHLRIHHDDLYYRFLFGFTILARVFAHLSPLAIFPAGCILFVVCRFVCFVCLFLPSVCVFPQPFFSTCSYLCLFIPFHVTVICCDTLLYIFPFHTRSCTGCYDYSITIRSSIIFLFFTQLVQLLHNMRIPGTTFQFWLRQRQPSPMFPLVSLPAESCLRWFSIMSYFI